MLRRYLDAAVRDDLGAKMVFVAGAPLSLNALREDLGVSHDSVRRWVAALERLYALVRVSPFGPPAIRAVKKAQKHYLVDWTLVPDLPQRFENLVAMALLKWVHQQQDAEGRDIDLRYYRDRDGREVDFVVTERGAPVLLVETKWSDTAADRNLRYLKGRFPDAEAWQLSAAGAKDALTPDGIRLAPAPTLLGRLA